jgi:hypothetical protein
MKSWTRETKYGHHSAYQAPKKFEKPCPQEKNPCPQKSLSRCGEGSMPLQNTSRDQEAGQRELIFAKFERADRTAEGINTKRLAAPSESQSGAPGNKFRKTTRSDQARYPISPTRM